MLDGPVGEVVSGYLELVYLVTALVPSETACLASSPGSSRRTAALETLQNELKSHLPSLMSKSQPAHAKLLARHSHTRLRAEPNR